MLMLTSERNSTIRHAKFSHLTVNSSNGAPMISTYATKTGKAQTITIPKGVYEHILRLEKNLKKLYTRRYVENLAKSTGKKQVKEYGALKKKLEYIFYDIKYSRELGHWVK